MEETTSPELASVDAFAEHLVDDDRDSFTFDEADRLATAVKTSTHKVISALEAYGLTYLVRAPVRKVRGFTSNSHDRWYGPGSCPSHGGSGHEQITGFAGDAR